MRLDQFLGFICRLDTKYRVKSTFWLQLIHFWGTIVLCRIKFGSENQSNISGLSVHQVISTGQYWRKTLVFVQLKHFQDPQTPGKGFFEKLSDNPREVWFIRLGYLLVFINGLASPFIKKIVKNYFFHVFPIHLCRKKV